MNIAVIYISKHGTTEKVANIIAEKLVGNQVSFFNLREDKRPDISSFEGIILGVSIYASQSSKLMQTFVKNQIEMLTTKRVGLFVCGMEPGKEKRQQELENAYPLSLRQCAVTNYFLGGEFLFEKMNFFERFVIKRIAKTDKSISQIDEDAIDKFVAEFINQYTEI
jgi:menaquinone-dependent protoporphyrinogen oxidase